MELVLWMSKRKEITKALTSDLSPAHYDPNKEIYVVTDD